MDRDYNSKTIRNLIFRKRDEERVINSRQREEERKKREQRTMGEMNETTDRDLRADIT